MRLLVATHSFDHDGAAMILSELIAHLRDRHGWPIDVLHSGRGPLCAALAARGVRFLEHARGADYDLALVNTAIGYEMVAKLARAMPVVFWVHEGRTYLHTTRATPRELTEAFASAIRIVFPVQWQSSRAFASFLSEASARRVRILPCGIRDLTTRAVTAQPRRGRSVRIAFVGSIHARKRVGDLAHAIRMLPGLDLECIAIGSTSQIDKLDAADHEAMLGQPDRFRLLGVLDGDELAAWLASADFFCHPSGDEAQALSALEAARSACHWRFRACPDTTESGRTASIA